MADPGDLNYKPLSTSSSGIPVLIDSSTIGTPTVAHTHPGGTADADLVMIWIANHSAAKRIVTPVLYLSSPTIANSLGAIELLPNSGAWVALDGVWLSGGCTIGFICDTINLVAFYGRVGRATLVAS